MPNRSLSAPTTPIGSNRLEAGVESRVKTPENDLRLAKEKIFELEAKIAIHERNQNIGDGGKSVSLAVDTDVIQNRLAKELENNENLQLQNDKLSEMVVNGQADRNSLLLQLSEQTSRVESLEVQVR